MEEIPPRTIYSAASSKYNPILTDILLVNTHIQCADDSPPVTV
ncbi:hypothetical protein SAMN05192552_10723 [Natrinema hispanicum]|uniref:Uncharacterized protein n=1 Tax=Natrinema hispanicum TaxID=392421 RepID=A0A1G6YRY1_9EURY|nr:hypothetical protein SAMN05192552_10723 [Natrinema hispanicum]SEU11890.1 hypothetical protein SAMN04488694_15113 [Natrinema hispanicum]